MKKAFIALMLTMASVNIAVCQNSDIDENWIESTLSKLTLEEKINLVHQQGKFCSAGVPRLGIPPLWMSDGPHGVRMEIAWNKWEWAGWTTDSVTVFPALTALAATWNPALAEQYGKALGEEALYRNKHVMLGPGVNIHRTPLNGRNFEYMSEDPYLAAQICAPYIKGVQSNGVAACVKHYALNNQETNRMSIDTYCSDRALHEIYLPAFKSAVDAGVWSIMGAYNKIRGTHASHNHLMLQEILKGDWKFDGVVISDWDATHNTDEAALNGLDLEMGTDSWNAGVKKMSPENCFMGNKYMEKIKTGELPVQSLDDKVRRILRLMLRTSMRKDKGLGCMTNEAHYSTAEEIGNEAIVLLQNRNSILPLRSGAKKILVVGDNAKRMLNEGGNSSELKAKDMISPLQGLIDEYGDKVVYTLGYSAGESVYGRAKGVDKATGDSLIAKATEMAKDADVVIFVGGLNKNEQQDCEGADRISYSLPFRQNELIESLYKANKNIVALLLCGTAVEIPWSDKVPAILNCWYLGSMGGKSIANVVSGKTNPSGKLPFTIGKKLNDYGSHSYDKLCFPGENGRVEYKEDILVGYRWFDTKNITPLFAFGHGKSYTQFSYGKPNLSSKSITDSKGLTVRIPVKNAGKRAGKEVVQLYVGEDNSKVLRPEKELKHFKKVMIQPGETEIVEFSISADDLKYYSDTDKCWKADKGNFTVSIGSSSADIRQKIKIVYE